MLISINSPINNFIADRKEKDHCKQEGCESNHFIEALAQDEHEFSQNFIRFKLVNCFEHVYTN